MGEESPNGTLWKATARSVYVMGAALHRIDEVARHVLADERRNAHEALHAITQMVDTARGALERKLSADDAQAELIVLRDSITQAADPKPTAPTPMVTVDDLFDADKD